MIVVPVLMTNCHESEKWNKGPVTAQVTMTAIAIKNDHGLPITLEVLQAKLWNHRLMVIRSPEPFRSPLTDFLHSSCTGITLSITAGHPGGLWEVNPLNRYCAARPRVIVIPVFRCLAAAPASANFVLAFKPASPITPYLYCSNSASFLTSAKVRSRSRGCPSLGILVFTFHEKSIETAQQTRATGQTGASPMGGARRVRNPHAQKRAAASGGAP